MIHVHSAKKNKHQSRFFVITTTTKRKRPVSLWLGYPKNNAIQQGVILTVQTTKGRASEPLS